MPRPTSKRASFGSPLTNMRPPSPWRPDARRRPTEPLIGERQPRARSRLASRAFFQPAKQIGRIVARLAAAPADRDHDSARLLVDHERLEPPDRVATHRRLSGTGALVQPWCI